MNKNQVTLLLCLALMLFGCCKQPPEAKVVAVDETGLGVSLWGFAAMHACDEVVGFTGCCRSYEKKSVGLVRAHYLMGHEDMRIETAKSLIRFIDRAGKAKLKGSVATQANLVFSLADGVLLRCLMPSGEWQWEVAKDLRMSYADIGPFKEALAKAIKDAEALAAEGFVSQ